MKAGVRLVQNIHHLRSYIFANDGLCWSESTLPHHPRPRQEHTKWHESQHNQRRIRCWVGAKSHCDARTWEEAQWQTHQRRQNCGTSSEWCSSRIPPQKTNVTTSQMPSSVTPCTHGRDILPHLLTYPVFLSYLCWDQGHISLLFCRSYSAGACLTPCGYWALRWTGLIWGNLWHFEKCISMELTKVCFLPPWACE